MKLPKLILASGSPRRAEILNSVGWEFTKDVADIDETELEGEKPEDYVLRLALQKAETVARKYDQAVVLGADTTVVINKRIIGKPSDPAEAREMIKLLSGNWHEVLTGVAIVRKVNELPQKSPSAANLNFQISNLRSITGIQSTKVKFAEMSDQEIDFLVEYGEPLDKAGAYAVQAQAALFIEQIKGDYWNVVGLPINLVYELMRSGQ